MLWGKAVTGAKTWKLRSMGSYPCCTANILCGEKGSYPN